MSSFSFTTVADALPPTITPQSPVNGAVVVSRGTPINIRITDNAGVNAATIQVSVNGTQRVVNGAAVNGAILTSKANAENGVDLEITLPGLIDQDTTVTVSVTATDINGNVGALSYSFKTMNGVRLISVSNPGEGILLARFNVGMRVDDAFLYPGNWEVTPVSVGAAPLTITEILGRPSQPELAILRYEGGGSTYQLHVKGLQSGDGSALSQGFADVVFEIGFPGPLAPTVHLFDTIWGPLGVAKKPIARRSVDQLVTNRAIATALNEQLRLRLSSTDGTAGRDGRPGGNR